MQEKIIDTEKTAEILGISKASIRNWMKHGYLNAVDSKGRFFQTSDVLNLKKEIGEGKIDRLRKRANKAQGSKSFIPAEYIKNKKSRMQISHLAEYIRKNALDMRMALLVLALNLFHLKGDVKTSHFSDVLAFQEKDFVRKSVYTELKDFYTEILLNKKETGTENGIDNAMRTGRTDQLEYLYHVLLPSEMDVLGIVYQSLLNEGKKSGLGSYFTPTEIVEDMVKENMKSELKVLDPCCGTGQFLLSFANFIDEPENIFGIDIDLTAVRIARFNLLLKIPGDFVPRVYHFDTLLGLQFQSKATNLFPHPEEVEEFDLVATNPPWGAKIDKHILRKLNGEFPDITSGESFSYFLRASLSLLKDKGRLSFILPEAMLYVRTHSDIRKTILDNCQIKKIECLGKRFEKVFSSVIRLDIVKEEPCGDEEVFVKRIEEVYTIPQKRFLENKWFVFDVYLNQRGEQILKKVFQTEYTTLEGKAIWALGIVTGDNHKFLKDKFEKGMEPIYKGSDVDAFVLREPRTYIRFLPENFQQVASEKKYRAKEKLIYRFISRTPVFAYDNKGSLTLNSANILIPELNYPLKVILALFNSSLYRFLFEKKFHSVKILKGDLEQLPLPLWKKEVFQHIIEMVDEIILGEKVFSSLDNYIMEQFHLSQEERSYIEHNLKQNYQ